jgi:hypothetical protein
VEREGNPKMAGSIAKALNKYFLTADVGNYHYNNLPGHRDIEKSRTSH